MKKLFLLLIMLLLAACASATPTPLRPTAVSSFASITETPPPPPTSELMFIETAIPATNTPLPPTATATATPTATPTSTIPAATVEIEGATLPPGFSMIKFADLVSPTSLRFDANGRLFAASQDGSIHIFEDTDGDGRADTDSIFADGFYEPLGIAFHPQTGELYLSHRARISILPDADGNGRADGQRSLVTDLPVGQHQNNNLKFGADGMLYMGVGSTCDVCDEADPRSATMMRFDPESGEEEIIASGLRNSFDLAFHPLTGDLFATENGRDDLGEEEPFEELNLIREGNDYGWPGCWNEGEGECAGTETAVAFFPPRMSANSLDFYTAQQFPPAYQNDAFAALFGSWHAPDEPTGVMRVKLTPVEDGYESEVEWFAQWDGAPLGLIVGPDGALYVGDYVNGAIYRISYGL